MCNTNVESYDQWLLGQLELFAIFNGDILDLNILIPTWVVYKKIN